MPRNAPSPCARLWRIFIIRVTEVLDVDRSSFLIVTLAFLVAAASSPADPRSSFLICDPTDRAGRGSCSAADLCRRLEGLEIRTALRVARESIPSVDDLTAANLVEVLEALPRRDVYREKAELIEYCLRGNLFRWDPITHQVVRVPGGAPFVRDGARRRLDAAGLITLIEYLDGPHAAHMSRYIDPVTRLALGGGSPRFAILELNEGQASSERARIIDELRRSGRLTAELEKMITTYAWHGDVPREEVHRE